MHLALRILLILIIEIILFNTIDIFVGSGFSVKGSEALVPLIIFGVISIPVVWLIGTSTDRNNEKSIFHFAFLGAIIGGSIAVLVPVFFVHDGYGVLVSIMTGPVGFVLGAIGGYIYGVVKKDDSE